MKTRTSVMAVVLAVMMAGAAFAGSLEAPAAPDDPASAMYTLESIYQRLATGAAGATRVGPFAEPDSAPSPTGHTLGDVMSKAPAVDNVKGAKPEDVKAGKTFWGLRSDGAWGLQTGASGVYVGGVASYFTCNGALSPKNRWCDQGDGTVMDMLSGLVWLKDTNCIANLAGVNKTGKLNWYDAGKWVSGLKSGVCGLTDGSVEGKWRVPNSYELSALTNVTEAEASLYKSPALFSNVQEYYYWSATASTDDPAYAWVVYPGGHMLYFDKTSPNFVCPVR